MVFNLSKICSLQGSSKYNVINVFEKTILKKDSFHQCCYTNKTVSNTVIHILV
jgi:hypothetical protein